MNVDNIEEATQNFSDFADVVEKETGKAIVDCDKEIDGLRDTMVDMNFNDSDIEQFTKDAEEAAETGTKL
jgi:hypothetical protein